MSEGKFDFFKVLDKIKHMMLDKILPLLYYALFLFTPLVMTSATSELFEFNKMIFIYIITILVLFIWILKMILFKRIILKKTPFDIPLLLFIASQIFSTLFSIDRHTSLYGYYGRFNGGLLSIISYSILYFAFTANFLSGKDALMFIKKFFKVSLLGSFLVILWGIPGKLGYDLSCFIFMGQFNNACWTDQFHPSERMFSTLGQPNWLGAYLAINFFIALYFLMKSLFISEFEEKITEKKGYAKKIKKDNAGINILLFGYLLMNFSSILFTRSRSALISVLSGLFLLVLFILFYFRRKIAYFSKELKWIVVLIIFIGASLIIFKTGIQKIDRYLDFSSLLRKQQQETAKKVTPPQETGYKITISESFDIRKIVWKGAIDLANKYPLFGSGLETFAYSYYLVRPATHNNTSEWDYLYNKAHNEYLNYVATTGYFGLLTYLFMIGAFIVLTLKVIYKLSKGEHIEDIFLLSALLLSYFSILVTNFFGFSTTTINVFFYWIPAVVMLVYYEKTEEAKDNQAHTISVSLSQWIYIGIVSLIALFLLISCINYFLADITYAKAEMYSKNGDYQTSAKLLTDALKMKYEHVYEDKLSYVLANLAIVASYQKQPQLSQEIITLAEGYNKKSINASPKNVLYLKTRAKNEYLFYQITLDKGRLIDGINTLLEAKKLSPTDPKIPYSLAIFYSLLYDEEKQPLEKNVFKTESLKQIENSIMLKPDYRDAYLLKGQLLKKFGEKNESRKIFEYILKNINISDEDAKKELQSL